MTCGGHTTVSARAVIADERMTAPNPANGTAERATTAVGACALSGYPQGPSITMPTPSGVEPGERDPRAH